MMKNLILCCVFFLLILPTVVFADPSSTCQQAVKTAYEIDDAKGPTIQSAQGFWQAVDTCKKDLSPDGTKKFQILKAHCEKKWESELGSMAQSFEAACEMKKLLKLIK